MGKCDSNWMVWQGLTLLTTLELGSNAIGRLEDINVLRKYTPQVVALDLRNNPICDSRYPPPPSLPHTHAHCRDAINLTA